MGKSYVTNIHTIVMGVVAALAASNTVPRLAGVDLGTIDEHKCDGCSLCSFVCPKNIIKMKIGQANSTQ